MIIPSNHPSWVFIDTGAYFALTYSKDANHSSAVSVMNSLIERKFRLYTSNFILAELHALLLSKINRRSVWNILNEIDNSDTTIIRVAQEDEHRAREIIVQYDDKNLSLTDSTSFSIINRLGIGAALTLIATFPSMA
jgi:predicted nucleic acid-binding protein